MIKRAEKHWASDDGNLNWKSRTKRRRGWTRQPIQFLLPPPYACRRHFQHVCRLPWHYRKRKNGMSFHWKKKSNDMNLEDDDGKKCRAFDDKVFHEKLFMRFLYYFLIQSSGSSSDPAHSLSTRRFSIIIIIIFSFIDGVLDAGAVFPFHWPLYDYDDYADLLFSVSRCRDTFTQSIYATHYVRAKMCKQTNCKMDKKCRKCEQNKNVINEIECYTSFCTCFLCVGGSQCAAQVYGLYVYIYVCVCVPHCPWDCTRHQRNKLRHFEILAHATENVIFRRVLLGSKRCEHCVAHSMFCIALHSPSIAVLHMKMKRRERKKNAVKGINANTMIRKQRVKNTPKMFPTTDLHPRSLHFHNHSVARSSSEWLIFSVHRVPFDSSDRLYDWANAVLFIEYFFPSRHPLNGIKLRFWTTI